MYPHSVTNGNINIKFLSMLRVRNHPKPSDSFMNLVPGNIQGEGGLKDEGGMLSGPWVGSSYSSVP